MEPGAADLTELQRRWLGMAVHNGQLPPPPIDTYNNGGVSGPLHHQTTPTTPAMSDINNSNVALTSPALMPPRAAPVASHRRRAAILPMQHRLLRPYLGTAPSPT